MLQFFLAPFLTLFSLRFYRRLPALPKSLGFLYIGYWALLFSVWGIIMFRMQSLPIVDEFMGWLSQSLPPMTLTRQGMQMELAQPQLLSHPRWGPVIYLDPLNDAPNLNQKQEAYVILTRESIAFFNPSRGEYRVQTLVPRIDAQTRWRDVQITGDKVLGFWHRIRPWIAVVFVAAILFLVYLWKLLAGLFYSLIGLILNKFRKDKLSYGSILNLTFFALSPVCILQMAAWTFSGLKLPLTFLTALVITTLYLALAILGTQEKKVQI